MSLFGRIVTVVVVATWVFPIYFFAHDMIFAWDLQFVRGMFCGVMLILLLFVIRDRIVRRSRSRTYCLGKDSCEKVPELDSERWHSSKRSRR